MAAGYAGDDGNGCAVEGFQDDLLDGFPEWYFLFFNIDDLSDYKSGDLLQLAAPPQVL